MNASLLLVAVLVAPPTVGGLPKTPAGVVNEIRDLYSRVNTAVSGGRTIEVVLVSDAAGFSGGAWRRAELKGGRTETGSDAVVATVSCLGGAPVRVALDVASPGGDWRNRTEYYLFPNGRTAFRFERHVTLLGPESGLPGVVPPFVVEKRLYLDERGSRVRELVSAFSEKTRAKVAANEVQQAEMPNYEGWRSFPFHGLVDVEMPTQSGP